MQLFYSRKVKIQRLNFVIHERQDTGKIQTVKRNMLKIQTKLKQDDPIVSILYCLIVIYFMSSVL